MGTNSSVGACDRFTGQCPCHTNVIGVQCDECAPLHFNLASGKGTDVQFWSNVTIKSDLGCSSCGCDPLGVVDANGQPHLECNNIDGQCHCKPGRGGRTCSECQDLHWGNPLIGECKRCECNSYGSKMLQCHRENGTCICNEGSGGPLCNECPRGYVCGPPACCDHFKHVLQAYGFRYTGTWPHCQPCGECFNNWDKILQGIRQDLDDLIEKANNIEDRGISSEYDASFETMEKQIEDVRAQLATVNVTKVVLTCKLKTAKPRASRKTSTTFVRDSTNSRLPATTREIGFPRRTPA